MMTRRMGIWGLLIGLGAATLLAGCGGGGTGTSGDRVPKEDPNRPSAVSGTIFSLALDGDPPAGILMSAVDAEVTLDGTADRPADQGQLPMHTQSVVRGGYQFVSVPPGRYTVTATVRDARDPDRVLSGRCEHLRAKGNIPLAMANVLVGDAANFTTFRGTIRQDGQPAVDAIVSIDISGVTSDYLRDGRRDEVALIMSTTTDDAGQYRFDVPACGSRYYLAAHSATSMVQESEEITEVTIGGTQTIDLTLPAAASPVFGELQLDIVSTTLPAPSVAASADALIARTAIATTRKAPQAYLDRLAQMRTQRRATRAEGALVENDIFWMLVNDDVGVRGFHVARATALGGPYTRIGSTTDPYQMLFFDNTPALAWETPTYYRVSSYAANGKVSSPSTPIIARPLPPLFHVTPADEATLPVATARIEWPTLSGARRYTVVLYAQQPTFNIVPIDVRDMTSFETSLSLSYLAPGTYWWGVSAFNTDNPNDATASSFTAFRKITLTE